MGQLTEWRPTEVGQLFMLMQPGSKDKRLMRTTKVESNGDFELTNTSWFDQPAEVRKAIGYPTNIPCVVWDRDAKTLHLVDSEPALNPELVPVHDELVEQHLERAAQAAFEASLPRGANGTIRPGHTTWEMLGTEAHDRWRRIAKAARDA